MADANIMPVKTDALLADTTHLSAEEFGAYLLLLFVTWRRNGRPLPDDDEVLRKVCRVSASRWHERLRPALAPFFDLTEGVWRQKRLETTFADVQERIETNRQNGRRGGRPAKSLTDHAHTKATGLFSDMPQHSDGEPKRNLSMNHEPKPKEESSPTGIVAAPGADDLATAVDAYNAVAKRCGLALATLTDERRPKLRQRLKQHGLDGWRLALAKLAENRWMHGDNERSWRANLDFLLRPISLTKLLEGAYDRDTAGADDVSERRRPQAPPRPEDLGNVG